MQVHNLQLNKITAYIAGSVYKKTKLKQFRLSIHKMAQIRYYYDETDCNYKRIRPSKWRIFVNGLGFLAVSFLFATGIFWCYSTYVDSPKEVSLRKENYLLRCHYDKIRQEMDKNNQILAHLQEQDNSLYRMILEIEPLPRTATTVGVGDGSRYQEPIDQNKLIAATAQKVDQLTRQLATQNQSYDELKKLAKNNAKKLAAIPSIQPLANKDLRRLSSPFGMRLHPIHKIPIMHEGVDFAAPRGTPIYATGDGVVKLTKKSIKGYGHHVEIDHGYGFMTKYCHMQKFRVKPGQKVTRGQCIGDVGDTGSSTSPHLHYEVIRNSKKINPAHYFSNDLDAKQYDMLLELATRKIQTPS